MKNMRMKKMMVVFLISKLFIFSIIICSSLIYQFFLTLKLGWALGDDDDDEGGDGDGESGTSEVWL